MDLPWLNWTNILSCILTIFFGLLGLIALYYYFRYKRKFCPKCGKKGKEIGNREQMYDEADGIYPTIFRKIIIHQCDDCNIKWETQEKEPGREILED